MIGLIADFVERHFFITAGLLLASFIPVFLGVKLLGGNVSMVKLSLIGILLSLATAASGKFIGFPAGAVMAILAISVYHLVFRVTTQQALLAWALQYVFVSVSLVLMVYMGV
ncbi:hypothetical protein HYV84_05300 [Candidatus Woesearchaeota archaeon]|nr:hypothetical protein [Candidatus Woesearchaeota archaeon]